MNIHSLCTYCRESAVAFAVLIASAFLILQVSNAEHKPVVWAVTGMPAIEDAAAILPPSQIHLRGLLESRYSLSEKNRLLKVNEEELLDGFRHRPGSMEWIGEHVGKWLDAASLTYACTGNADLRAKLDHVAAELIKTQEGDGYLGTYTADKRFGKYPGAHWDVWVHQYDLTGLLSYYRYTGNTEALQACRRIADLLIKTFGPGKKSIIDAGAHDGMAATSVLEPMVRLYQADGDRRYLDFARYIVSSWDTPHGPHLLSALLKDEPVYRIGDAKAYEMLSNLVGLCELYRVTGEEEYLTAVMNAWSDISAHHLYITGSGSIGEVWHADGYLPGGEESNICETCVTVTWMQLNMQLLRLTGESRFAEELEKSAYNHLLSAQKPTGDDWCYYTPLNGHKHYDKVLTCCHSSGPRGVALIPLFMYTTTQGGIAVNLFSPSEAVVPLVAGGEVRLEQSTDYPLDGQVVLTVDPKGVRRPFAIGLRIPVWSRRVSVAINKKPLDTPARDKGYIIIKRRWKKDDAITYDIDMSPRVMPGGRGEEGRMAVMYGPLVLALDKARNSDKKTSLCDMSPAEDSLITLRRVHCGDMKDGDTAEFEMDGLMRKRGTKETTHCKLNLIPYYDAGTSGSPFLVYMTRPELLASRETSLFEGAEESRSRSGNVAGSISDESFESFVVTYDGTKQREDWYALTLPNSVIIRRVVFIQGKLFHDGGWFDTSAGKPRIQGKSSKDGLWIDLGVIDSYPDTTATSRAGLRDFQNFQVSFKPVSVCAIRVIGKPACGDNPRQAFSSCSGLRAYNLATSSPDPETKADL